MVEQMRQITDNAAAKTRRARWDVERRLATPAPRATPPAPLPPTEDSAAEKSVRPFEVIEQW
ncbi:hypothetical protein ACFV1N_11760 [Streptosporangium canum]|uniref:hypothetical protein n=1 Tax=Streptosporangium canum TaxID=324952 RepID=UPI00368CE472